MSHAMVVIPLDSPLNLFTVRKALIYLRGEGVQKFNDGFYHVSISQDGMEALLSGFSEHDADAAGFEVVNDNPKRIIFAGLRWEIDSKTQDVKIYGPKSDPSQAKVIDGSENL